MEKLIKKPIVLLMVCISYISWGQDIAIEKSFFDTANFRLGAALGYDVSWAGDDGGTALMSTNGSIDDDHFYFAKTPSQTYFLGLDAYSPTSTLGFLGGVGLNFQEYSVRGQNGVLTDSIKTTNIEIPLYLRLRFGKVQSVGQLWLALGGGYSINSKAEVILKASDGTIISTSEENKQFNSHPFLSGIVGYEFQLGSAKQEIYSRDTFRILLYAKTNYDLGNRLDEKNIVPSSAIATYTDPSIEYLRISFGVKILLRLSKAGEIMGESLIKNLNQQ